MNEKPIVFDGSVAQNYDNLLGAFIFEPFALDLMDRISILTTGNILELASGTGRVTNHLSQRLTSATITASDLNPEMISVAKQRISGPYIIWKTIDMMAIPFEDEHFDMIVCQFGIMFAPDKLKALTEIHRVLKKGGKLIFNTWGPIEKNKIWQMTSAVVNSFLGDKPTGIFSQGPFSLQDEKAVVQLIGQAGFTNTTTDSVTKISEIASATKAAKGFIQGLPVLKTIQENAPESLHKILDALTINFKHEFGDEPLKASLNAWVFESIK